MTTEGWNKLIKSMAEPEFEATNDCEKVAGLLRVDRLFTLMTTLCWITDLIE